MARHLIFGIDKPVRKVIRYFYNRYCRWRLVNRSVESVSVPFRNGAAGKPRVLACGIYLANRKNAVEHLVSRFSESAAFDVTQAWVALNGPAPSDRVQQVTIDSISGFVPKFAILNRLIARVSWQDFDYLIICDDDIFLPQGFLDAYLALQEEFDFALAQPARTRNSFADRKFVRQRKGVRGRKTRFVEIGPLFSVRKDLARLILPFDEQSPMGWGYDFVWPVVAEAAGVNMGIIDATPVDHSLRDQAAAYDKHKTSEEMERYLRNNRHLNKKQAFSVLEEYQ